MWPARSAASVAAKSSADMSTGRCGRSSASRVPRAMPLARPLATSTAMEQGVVRAPSGGSSKGLPPLGPDACEAAKLKSLPVAVSRTPWKTTVSKSVVSKERGVVALRSKWKVSCLPPSTVSSAERMPWKRRAPLSTRGATALL